MMIRLGWAAVFVLASASSVSCSSTNATSPGSSPDSGGDDATTTPPDDSGSDAVAPTVTQTVGTSGGTVSAQGLVLTIPAGALAGDTSIVIAPDAAPVPPGYTGLSPLYSFGPDGTVFLKPITVDFIVTASGATPTVYWSNASGGYDPLATTLTGTTASASVTHFSKGFVGVGAAASDDGGGSDDGGAADATTNEDAGAIADAGTITDSTIGAQDTGIADAEADAHESDSGTTFDAGAGDAGAPAIHVTIDGVPTTFASNVKATTNGNSVWTIQADTNPSGVRWHLQLVVVSIGNPTTACGTSTVYPQITYTDFLNGAAVATFQTEGTCSVTVDTTPTAADAGQRATGAFSATVVLTTDGGTIDAGASHVLSNGTYDGLF